MPPDSGAVLAFDFGAKRIGVAVGHIEMGIAHPIAQISFEDNRHRLEAIARLVEEWRPVQFVLGVPTAGASQDRSLAPRIRRFAERLKTRFGVPVDCIDEHLTSWEASHNLSRAGVRAERQKPYVDQLAACVILEAWFEEKRRPAAQRTNAGP